MEATVEGDEVLAAGGIAGQLEGGFHRLGAGVAVEDALGKIAGGNGSEPLRQGDHALVVEVGPGHVNELAGLPADGLDHLRVAVAGGDNGDAGGEI
jgi:hypothetical protein